MSAFVTLLLLLAIPAAVMKIIGVLLHRNCKSKVCLVGKTALVTGGCSGIGYQIVLALAQRRCRVIIADKIEDKNLLENVYKETDSRNVVFKYVDLSSFKSVRDLANNVIKDEEKLDILINNAGMGSNLSLVTEDGLDVTMQVNYFSAFLLTRLLEDLLKKSKSRIVFTSSGTCYFHNFTIKKLKYAGTEFKDDIFYPTAKLCLIMISDMFAERLKEYGVTSNTYHPGVVRTKIFKRSIRSEGSININWLLIKLFECMSLLAGKTPEEGAQTAIYLACAKEVEGVTGKYFYETKETFKPKIVHDKKTCGALWEATEKIVNSKLN